MAIIKIISNTVEEVLKYENAYCPLDDYNRKEDVAEGRVITLVKTHIGMCVAEYERNMYHDSDFYMWVWDDEKGEATSIQFATTSFWTYPCFGSSVDASDEIKDKFYAWQRQKERNRKAWNLWNQRKKDIELADEMQLKNYHEVRKLKRVFIHKETFEAIRKLLKVKNFRSSFRESMAKQVRAWINDPNPKFPSPLSNKQLQWI